MNPFAEQAVYAQIGDEGFSNLTAAFYRRVATDDILGPLYEQARRETGEPEALIDQAPDRDDIINIGGFSDAVFDLIAAFARGELSADHWVGVIDGIEL